MLLLIDGPKVVMMSQKPSFLGWLILCVCAVQSSCGAFVYPSVPEYEKLEGVSSSKLHEDPTFINALKHQAGYYTDPSRAPHLSSTVLITAINDAYSDFYHNFRCNAERLGIKFLTLSLDKDIYHYLNNQTVSYLMPNMEGRDQVHKTPARFGSKPFNLIGCRKMEAVYAALRLGFDVLFSDVDIVFMQDPLPYVFIDGVDHVHSQNWQCLSMRPWGFYDKMEGNTGFYAVKSNPRTIRTWDLTTRACSQAPLYDDQTILWLILRTNGNPSAAPLNQCPKPRDLRGKTADAALDYIASHSPIAIPKAPFYGSANRSSVYANVYTQRRSGSSSRYSFIKDAREHDKLVTCPLNNCMFSAGNLKTRAKYKDLLQGLQQIHEPAITVHANWISGKTGKVSNLKQFGLWVAPSAAESRARTREIQNANDMLASAKTLGSGVRSKGKSAQERPRANIIGVKESSGGGAGRIASKESGVAARTGDRTKKSAAVLTYQGGHVVPGGPMELAQRSSQSAPVGNTAGALAAAAAAAMRGVPGSKSKKSLSKSRARGKGRGVRGGAGGGTSGARSGSKLGNAPADEQEYERKRVLSLASQADRREGTAEVSRSISTLNPQRLFESNDMRRTAQLLPPLQNSEGDVGVGDRWKCGRISGTLSSWNKQTIGGAEKD